MARQRSAVYVMIKCGRSYSNGSPFVDELEQLIVTTVMTHLEVLRCYEGAWSESCSILSG